MATFDPKHLSDAQRTYLAEHAVDLWNATLCLPNDDIEALLSSDCACCAERRAFVLRVIATK